MSSRQEYKEAILLIGNAVYWQYTYCNFNGSYKKIQIDSEVEDLELFEKENKAVKLIVSRLNTTRVSFKIESKYNSEAFDVISEVKGYLEAYLDKPIEVCKGSIKDGVSTVLIKILESDISVKPKLRRAKKEIEYMVDNSKFEYEDFKEYKQ